MENTKISEEVKASFTELKEILDGKKKGIPALEGIRRIERELKEERRGGKRAGAGAKKKNREVKLRGVKLTDKEYNQITKKYGTFAAAVKSLLATE